MNLNTVTAVRRPASAAEVAQWHDGDAWLAGGTWLFSEPQPAIDTLIDLDRLGWPALEASAAGLEIAATCRIAELYHFAAPRQWTAAPLFRACCESLLASFKIWNAATVGGNICMSLPAGADDLADGSARRRLHALAARRGAARGAGRRFRHRQPRQRAAARRIAAQHPSAGGGARPSGSRSARRRSPSSAAPPRC